ncbi:MAG: hypothetical protein IN808_02475 [Rubrobacter sp.]|nr:hypothetical protein [Rubrobacter sp.]
MIYGDNRILSGEEKRRVLLRVRERGFACPACGSEGFEVGEALPLGFLWFGEEPDAYMVALTCRNPNCPSPRTGIRLEGSGFLLGEDE